MSSLKGQASQHKSASGNFLDRIPLSLRVVFYGATFLSVLLIGLPWLAYRIDVLVPAWHVDNGALRIVGAVLFVVALAVYVRSSHFLTSRGHGAYVEFDPPSQFVATGMYRWIRNPIAGSAVLMLAGEAVAFSSTGIALLSLAGMLIAHLQVVFLEEPLLRKRFGQSYADYLQRVPRWIPRAPGRPAP